MWQLLFSTQQQGMRLEFKLQNILNLKGIKKQTTKKT